MKIYLAGPDVFFPSPRLRGKQLKNICRQYGFEGVFPLDSTVNSQAGYSLPKSIAYANETHISRCDLVIANLTPFRGISADAGTLYEVGYARGLGKKIFGWSNIALTYLERCRQDVGLQIELDATGEWRDKNSMQIENFSLSDNLMVTEGIHFSGGKFFTPDIIKESSLPLEDLRMFDYCLSFICQHK